MKAAKFKKIERKVIEVLEAMNNYIPEGHPARPRKRPIATSTCRQSAGNG